MGIHDNGETVVGPIVVDVDADEDLFDNVGRPKDDLVEFA